MALKELIYFQYGQYKPLNNRKETTMTIDAKFSTAIISVVLLSILLLSFAIIISVIVDSDKSKSFKRIIFTDGIYLVYLAFLYCVLEYSKTLII